jgi:cyclic pyranopterin phosphate synthase
MVSISHKATTSRLANAHCTIDFSTPVAIPIIRANQLSKGDVLAVSRIAGIMAAKRTPELIPLCHPIGITHVEVELDLIEGNAAGQRDGDDDGKGRGSGNGGIEIRATVACDGKTGVEMEALTAASVAALTVYDMCKAVDKGMRVEGLRVVRKEGGKSGSWVEGRSVKEEEKENKKKGEGENRGN